MICCFQQCVFFKLKLYRIMHFDSKNALENTVRVTENPILQKTLTWINCVPWQGDKYDQHHEKHKVEEEVDTDAQPFNCR